MGYLCEVELMKRSSGNEAIDTMAFLHLLEQLKVGFGSVVWADDRSRNGLGG